MKNIYVYIYINIFGSGLFVVVVLLGLFWLFNLFFNGAGTK